MISKLGDVSKFLIRLFCFDFSEALASIVHKIDDGTASRDTA
jgi:hypothetical protein